MWRAPRMTTFCTMRTPVPPRTAALSSAGMTPRPRVFLSTPFSVRSSQGTMATFRSDGFYWTSDSKSLGFGDFYDGRLNLILVKVDGDSPRAYSYTYRVPPCDDCLSRISPSVNDINLVNFRNSELPGNSFAVHAELRPLVTGYDLCGARFADAPFSSFEPAKPEHRTVRSRRPSVSNPNQ